ncbi:PXA domain-containing protein [Haematococcus lacustris]
MSLTAVAAVLAALAALGSALWHAHCTALRRAVQAHQAAHRGNLPAPGGLQQNCAAVGPQPSFLSSSAQEERCPDAWRARVGSPLVEFAWDKLCGSIVQQWVYDTWWAGLTPDTEFPAAVRLALNNAFGAVCMRARRLDLGSLLVRDVCEVLVEAVEAQRSARTRLGPTRLAALPPAAREAALRAELQAAGALHPALCLPQGHYQAGGRAGRRGRGRAAGGWEGQGRQRGQGGGCVEDQGGVLGKVLGLWRVVLGEYAELLLAALLPGEPLLAARPLRVAARELLAGCVLRPVIMMCWPQNIVKLLLPWLNSLSGGRQLKEHPTPPGLTLPSRSPSSPWPCPWPSPGPGPGPGPGPAEHFQDTLGRAGAAASDPSSSSSSSSSSKLWPHPSSSSSSSSSGSVSVPAAPLAAPLPGSLGGAGGRRQPAVGAGWPAAGLVTATGFVSGAVGAGGAATQAAARAAGGRGDLTGHTWSGAAPGGLGGAYVEQGAGAVSRTRSAGGAATTPSSTSSLPPPPAPAPAPAAPLAAPWTDQSPPEPPAVSGLQAQQEQQQQQQLGGLTAWLPALPSSWAPTIWVWPPGPWAASLPRPSWTPPLQAAAQPAQPPAHSSPPAAHSLLLEPEARGQVEGARQFEERRSQGPDTPQLLPSFPARPFSSRPSLNLNPASRSQPPTQLLTPHLPLTSSNSSPGHPSQPSPAPQPPPPLLPPPGPDQGLGVFKRLITDLGLRTPPPIYPFSLSQAAAQKLRALLSPSPSPPSSAPPGRPAAASPPDPTSPPPPSQLGWPLAQTLSQRQHSARLTSMFMQPP